MRVVRTKDLSAQTEIRIPPGAYVSKFYHHDTLTQTTSGYDIHVTGARLIQLVLVVVNPSTSGPVVIAWSKNDVVFKHQEIPENEGEPVAVSLKAVESEGDGDNISMDFEAITDRLKIEILETGVNAASLTALGVFDR